MGLSLKVNGCCCMSLRTAGLVIGWISLVLFVFLIGITTKRIIFNDPKEESTPRDTIVVFTSARTLNIYGEVFALVMYILDAFVSGLLLFGIVKTRDNMLIPWLVFRAFSLVLTVPGVLIVLFFAILSLKALAILTTLIVAFGVGLLVWAWIVIYSLFQEIRETVVNKQFNVVQVPYQLPTAEPYYESGPVVAPVTSYSLISNK